jgi:ApbE superfamily uncharacterized protein (UPF0280 family)
MVTPMFDPPVVQELTGGRLHLSHGPVDVVLKAFGSPAVVATAHRAAAARFPGILPELCAELPILRAPLGAAAAPASPVATRMANACRPFADLFVTPMAAVAGAVADELLAVMRHAAPISRAFVNDGGDIAVFCGPAEHLDVAIAGEFAFRSNPACNGSIRISHGDGIGGIATSGARGRSFSLGIADSVTVLAADAATADVAATLIANGVDCTGAPVSRRPACELDPDSDLGERLVTVDVGPLSEMQIDAALEAGLVRARRYREAGLIIDVALMLQGKVVTMGADVSLALAPSL